MTTLYDLVLSVGSFCLTSALLYKTCRIIEGYLQKEKQLLQVLAEKSPIDFESVKSFPQGNNVQVALKMVVLKEKIIFKTIRQVPKMFVSKVRNQIFENACGNNFTIHYQNRDILVKITNSRIHAFRTLEIQDTNQLVSNALKDATHSDILFYIPPLHALTMIGTLSYGIIDDKFVFKPNFILDSIFQKEQITAFFSHKKGAFVAIGFTLLIGTIYLGYFACQKIYAYTNKLSQKKIDAQIQQPKEELSDIDFFKSKVIFSARKSLKLTCINCAVRVSNIAFDCGHITLCEDCLRPEQNVCSICRKRPRRWIKIFI